MHRIGAGLEAAKTLADLVRIGGLRAIVDLLRMGGGAALEARHLVAALPDPGRCPGSCPRSPPF
ncbi:MAG TPA: hypothetical protein VK424_06270 [Thermoplasmata archaeon]|nr:hypothetical protein [Thermoplasmata archaeon]